MKFSCLQENLNKGLNQVARIATSKGSLPILENVLLKTENGRLKMVTTDLEAIIIQWIGGKVEKEGSITVPCRLFTDYISSLPNNKLNLKLENEADLLIQTDENEATIKGQTSEEFPIIPEIKDKALITINHDVLSQAISQVVFAAALDDSRPVLSGVLFSFNKKTLKLVATDSYRLAEKEIALSAEVKNPKDFIIPAKTVGELQRILEGSEGEVEIKTGENQVLFHTKNTDIIARLIDGNFPDYKKIIPAQSSTKATIERNSLINIVKTASLFAKDSGNNIKMVFDPKGKVIVSATTSQVGINTSSAEALVEGAEGEISFNARYLMDVLLNLKENKISLEISGKLKPGMIKPENKKDYVHIIMPLSI